MVVNFAGVNVSEAYVDGIWNLKISGQLEESRNGPVLSIRRPVAMEIWEPWKRVLIDSVRQPNPYFHLAEFVWMMSGSNDATWISKYNTRMLEYAEDTGLLHGAYGYRWREAFGEDQIRTVIKMLIADPNTRRAVLSMWDPNEDLVPKRDLPCNTHIYLRVCRDVAGSQKLNMTVCNRSNDFFWGMMGANVAHMTLLHELISHCIGVQQGTYTVFSNNLHAYLSIPRYNELMRTTTVDGCPYRRGVAMTPLMLPTESYRDFVEDCEAFVEGVQTNYQTHWFSEVFLPMMRAYDCRLAKVDETEELMWVHAEDWRAAGFAWKSWRENEISTTRNS